MTTLFKNCCRSSRLAVPAVLGLLAALLPHPVVAADQATAEELIGQKYQRAMELYKSGEADKTEEACELFQQIEKERPGYKETGTYLGPACIGAKGAYATEEKLYKQGVRLLSQKRLEEAKQNFEQASKIPLKHPKYRTEIEGHLKDIEKEMKEIESQRIKAAVREKVAKLSATGQDPKQVAQQLVIDAQAAMRSRQYSAALQKLAVAESLFPTNRDARRLLTQVQELASEEPLRAGLEAYFQSKYEEADHNLTDYLNSNNGHKRALAYFFRGASHATRYFLSGERNAQQKEMAQADFRALQKNTTQFQPPKKYVSPKILSLYLNAVAARAR